LAVSKKQQACVDRYKASHYDLIRFNVAKGGKDIIKTAAQKHGKSPTVYIIDLIREGLARDGLILPDRANDTNADADAE